MTDGLLPLGCSVEWSPVLRRPWRDEPGLSPRLRYTLTDRGRAQVEKNRGAFKGQRRGDRAA